MVEEFKRTQTAEGKAGTRKGRKNLKERRRKQSILF